MTSTMLTFCRLQPLACAQECEFIQSKRVLKMKPNATPILFRALAIVTFLLASSAFYMSWNLQSRYVATSPNLDGYVPPRSVADLVDQTQRATVTVDCKPAGKREGSFGSGWSILRKELQRTEFPKKGTAIITNHHVIEDCLFERGKVTVKDINEHIRAATILKWDEQNDLAILSTTLKVPTLKLSPNSPYSGYWVMAVGTADGYEGSVAFGNVLNATYEDILITASISHGNSGGPLIDNEGFVIGTNTFSQIGEQYNGSKSLDAMCARIIKCPGEHFWDW